jgi:hypothetical protein
VKRLDELEAYLDSKPPEEDACAPVSLGRTYAALGDAKKAQDSLRHIEENGPRPPTLTWIWPTC